MSENEQKQVTPMGTGTTRNEKENKNKKPFIRSVFKGANENVATLCTRAEKKKKDQYIIFQKSLEQHVTTSFTNSGDILPVIRDLIDPMKELLKGIPKRESMKDILGESPLTTQPPSPDIVTSGAQESEGGTNVFEPVETIEDSALKESLDFLYKEEMKMFANRRNVLQQNQIKLWGVIWGQCSPALQTEIKGNDDFLEESNKYNCVWLLQKLKLAAAGIDRSVSSYQALVNSLTFFHTLRQQRDESIENYRRRFESAWNSAVMNHASVGQHPAFVKFAIEDEKSPMTAQGVEDKLAATYFITFADPSRFQGLWESLSNATLLGRDDYPNTITAAYDLLSHFRGPRRNNVHDGPINVSFAQVSDNRPPLPGTNGETLKDISCWKCI